METPIKNKLLNVLNDPSETKERRGLAAEILSWYSTFDIPGEADKGIVATLAEFRAERFWLGEETIADHAAKNCRPM